MQYEQGPGFADLLTPRVLTVLGTLVACFVAQSVFADQLPELSLYPIPAGFQPWQPLTYSLSQPTPVTAIVDWIVLTFLLEFGWAALGTRTFWLATASTWAFATLGTVALGAIWPEAGRVPISGTGWWFGAILVFWAMKHRGRSLRLLYYRDLGSAHLVLAFFASFTVLLFDEDNWRRWRLQRRRKEIERQLSRLTVLEGGKGQERPRRRGVDDRVN
jgi:membrane associated rhomboid family serine protease